MGVPYVYGASQYAYGKPIWVYSYGLSHMHTRNIRMWVRMWAMPGMHACIKDKKSKTWKKNLKMEI